MPIRRRQKMSKLTKSMCKHIRWQKAGLVRTPSGKLVHLNKAQMLQMEHAAERARAAYRERKASGAFLGTPEERRVAREDAEWEITGEPKRPEVPGGRPEPISRRRRPETARIGEKTHPRAGAEKTAKTTRARPGERKPRTVSEEARRLQDNVSAAETNLKATQEAFGSGTVLARRAEDDYNEALGKLKAFKNRRKR